MTLKYTGYRKIKGLSWDARSTSSWNSIINVNRSFCSLNIRAAVSHPVTLSVRNPVWDAIANTIIKN